MTGRIDNSNLLESKWLIAFNYAICGITLLVVWQSGSFSTQHLGVFGWLIAIAASALAIFLFSITLFQLASYFVFMPSIKGDSHIFATVHSSQLIHPLTSSVILASMVVCLLSRSGIAWFLWATAFTVYVLQTASIVNRIRSQDIQDYVGTPPQNLPGLLAYLILGAEVVTMAAGAKGIAPWKIKKLPLDTWIVDVRTPGEFKWNRLYGAENFPWGSGLIAASQSIPKDRPVLVTCLSGHRSPAVAVMMRKIGFQNVYNLNWGLLYLILLERGKTGSGIFDLTRPNRPVSDRGKDYKGISYGYITCALIILIMAPIESALEGRSICGFQKVVGAMLGGTGFMIAWLAFRALGRNFRVFAAPRRSGTLVRTGVYSKVRHPMYTAVIVGFAGYVIFWGGYWSAPFWVALTILYVVKAIKEEGVLAQRYPDYPEYVSGTKRFLPYLF